MPLAPVEEMGLAVAELANPATDPERRADMRAFLDLAGKELGSLVRRTAEDLDGMRNQVEHIQTILTDQQRISHAQPVVEPVVLSSLLDETVRLLPKSIRDALIVEIDPVLKQAPPVTAVRIVLQQVVSNLLINAAEAVVPDAQPRPVCLRVSADEDTSEGMPMNSPAFCRRRRWYSCRGPSAHF